MRQGWDDMMPQWRLNGMPLPQPDSCRMIWAEGGLQRLALLWSWMAASEAQALASAQPGPVRLARRGMQGENAVYELVMKSLQYEDGVPLLKRVEAVFVQEAPPQKEKA